MTDNRFETQLRAHLQKELPDRANALIGAYYTALDYLKSHVYEEIRAKEPNLTDHGPRHVANVQDNILRLLLEFPLSSDDDMPLAPISAIEMYLLAMFILFHDVGNIRQRDGHQLNIGSVFDAARGLGYAVKREKTLVLRACAAHTGKNSEGSRDTLKGVSTTEQFEGNAVNLRQLAAILRFADELAEGPQRTSEYRLAHNDYDPKSRVHHEYAAGTYPFIDRGNQRISLAFEISVDADPNDPVSQQKSLKSLLSHILTRITKLDEERRYAVHYSPLLDPFKSTVASFNFHCGENLLDFYLPQIQLDDFTVPGTTNLHKKLTGYSPAKLATDLIRRCRESKEAI